ncbi:hypothetical protein CEXT_380441 [Caerostris extrusa]|uniref:Adenosine kinase n=1 Tax=Caerostris extrusa TaxID=172846 RepID=A0AAV4M368_CAEEX|nr:hypothetical protein CEXT_380441 [Caerostris extrusa]
MSHGTLQNGTTSNGNRIGQTTTESVHLLFVGAPLLDISVKCDEETRRYYGLKSDDCILSRKEHDELFQQIFHNPESHLAAGGSAQNAARIAKWKLGTKGEVAFAGQFN